MFLARLAVKRPVLTSMLVMAFVVLGLFSWRRLVIDLLPEVEIPFVTVSTVYPGAGPAEVETQITKRVEDAVSSIGNIKSLESISRENLSLVLIEFDLGVDVDLAAIDVKDKVEAVRAKFPRDAEAPVVVKFDINAMPIIDLAVSSPRPLEEVYRTTKDVIKDYISRVEGVANVNIIGGKKREIQVNVDKRLMRAYGLSLAQVVGAVASENLNLPTGRITEKRKEYSLRLLGEFRSLQELARIRIPAGENASVYLSDIAQVVDGFADQRDLARFNGKPTVGVEIQKRSGANTVKVSEGVYHALAELEQILPADYEVTVAHDRSRFIRDAVTDVTKNIFIGILLTTVLLYLFLHSFKITLVAAIAMPTSVVASFLLIDFAHFTLNIMTLMALGITVGVLVTNSIVVLENIIRHLRMGKDPARAAVDGTSEVTIAVVASTLTNVVVFTPIAFMSGIVGRFFYQFGLTVVFATIFSLVVSFTLTPLLASRFLGGGAGRREREGALGWFESAWNRFYGTLEELYRRALARALARKTQVLAFTFLAFVVAFFLLSQVGAEFMPTLDEGFVRIELEMPPGTSLEETDRVLREVEGILARLPETVSVLSSIGGPEQGVEDATVILRIVDKSERDRGIVDFANDLKPLLAAIPDADVRIKVSSERAREESDIVLNVMGPDRKVLEKIGAEIYDSLATIAGLASLKTTVEEEKPELVFRPRRMELDRFGVTSAIVAMALRTGYEGQVASRYREGDEEYDIRVRYRPEQRSGRAEFIATEVLGKDNPVPLTQLGSVETGGAPREILRRDREKLVRVEANVGSGALGDLVKEIRWKLRNLDLPPGYRIHYGGMVEMQEESFSSIFTALILAVILTYMVLAGVLESFIHPVTVMMTLPLGLVGMALALFVAGQTVNIFSLMALVMLVGIVVNNAILLLDYTSVLRNGGMSRRQALLEACPVRLRPIIMANLAIAIGMLPQALGGAGSEFRAVMASVTMGGVLISAVFTLFLIPVIYDLLDRGE